jgi:hypothetical protein
VHPCNTCAHAHTCPNKQGNSTLYACAIDAEGSRACGSVVVAVKPPGASFNASAALASMDVNAILEVPFVLPYSYHTHRYSYLDAYLADRSF